MRRQCVIDLGLTAGVILLFLGCAHKPASKANSRDDELPKMDPPRSLLNAVAGLERFHNEANLTVTQDLWLTEILNNGKCALVRRQRRGMDRPAALGETKQETIDRIRSLLDWDQFRAFKAANIDLDLLLREPRVSTDCPDVPPPRAVPTDVHDDSVQTGASGPAHRR